jgi:hypothetical protein
VYSVLVAHAGARENNRQDFVYRHVAWSENNPYETTEYRFMGRLGSGGKFWCGPESFRVNTYSEEYTPERERMMDNTNTALRELFTPPEVCPECEWEKLTGNPARSPHACEG